MSDEPFVSIETQLLYRYLKESRPPVNLTIGEKKDLSISQVFFLFLPI